MYYCNIQDVSNGKIVSISVQRFQDGSSTDPRHIYPTARVYLRIHTTYSSRIQNVSKTDPRRILDGSKTDPRRIHTCPQRIYPKASETYPRTSPLTALVSLGAMMVHGTLLAGFQAVCEAGHPGGPRPRGTSGGDGGDGSLGHATGGTTGRH